MSDNRPVNRALAAAQLAKDHQKEPTHTPQTPDRDTNPMPVEVENEQVVPAEPKPEPKPKPQSVFLNKSANVKGANPPPAQKAPQKSPPVIISGLSPDRPQVEEQGGDPKFTKVDISISGTPHRINCPTADVMNLNRTADQINEALRDIRRSVRGKSPSNEELLVLHCLDLYDQMRELIAERDQNSASNQRASALLDKILKDVGSIGNLGNWVPLLKLPNLKNQAKRLAWFFVINLP